MNESVASIEQIRAHFPALERFEAGHPVAYFDGPGGTQIPRAVAEAVTDYLFHHNANTHWQYPSSAETDAALEGARAALADFLGASPDEIAFGNNMTALTFHLSRALGRGWGAGDEIVVTQLDHQANVAPWEALVVERGVTLRTVPMVEESGTLDLGAVQAAITGRTRLVAIGAASNALGTINDLETIVAMAQAVGAQVFVDAVHHVAHQLMDVNALDCDYLACSAYKFYGTHIGILYGKKNRLEELDLPRVAPAPDYAPDRFESGTLNHEGIVGAAAAVDFLASLGDGGSRRERLTSSFSALHQRGQGQVARMWEGLSSVPGVSLYGPPPEAPRTPTISFTLAGHSSESVATQLSAQHGVFVSHGDFYASGVTEALGLADEGLVRAGCACYTTDEEVDRLVAGVRSIAGAL